jgi:hypothetical protein
VVTAFIWRAEPIVRVVLAARAFGEGAFKPDQFEAVADFAAKVLVAPLDPKTLVGTFREGVSMLGLPWPGGDPFSDPRIPGKPPFSSYLAPENQAWMHCAMGLAQLFPPLPSIPKTSPPPGSPTPATICQGSIPALGLDIKLTSVGVGFGQQGDWGIALRGVAATIVVGQRAK